MSSNPLKSIYEEVFEKLIKNPEIQGIREGALYKVIQIILGEEQSDTQKKTREICDRLGIREDGNKAEDFGVIANFTEVVLDRQPGAKHLPEKTLLSQLAVNVNQFVIDDEEKMKWIIVSACALVGVYFCVQYLKDRQQRERDEQEATRANSLPPPQSAPSPAVLFLIVPAKIASSLTINTDLRIDSVKHLIDNASYFLCTRLREADSIEQRLELSDDYGYLDSQQETYVRIEISDGGQVLIDKKVPYALKTNLSNNARFTIKRIACLGRLFELNLFNRI
jgi:hypothetical protein